MINIFKIQEGFFRLLVKVFEGSDVKIFKILKGEDLKKYVLIESVKEEVLQGNVKQFNVLLHVSCESYEVKFLQEIMERILCSIKQEVFLDFGLVEIINIKLFQNFIINGKNGFEGKIEYLCFFEG